MATSYSGWVATDDYRTRIDYSITSETATQVTIKGETRLQSGSGGYASNWPSSWDIVVNGSKSSGSGNLSFGSNSTTGVLASKSVTVNKAHTAQSISVKGTVNSYAGGAMASGSVTVSALASYAVTYNANGGSGAPSAQTKWYGEALTLSSTKPTRTNYTFLGWSTSSTATTATYAAGASYTGNAALALYAVWKLAFVAPTISKVTAFRSDSSGASEPSSTSHIHIDVTWSVDTTVTAGNKGQTVAVVIKSGSTEVASGSASVSTTSGTTSFTLAPTTSGDTFSGSYVVSATITDTNSQTATKNAYISGLFKPFTMANQGQSAAFFGIADALATNLLKIFGKLWVEGRIASYVEGARGNAGIAFYKKELNVNQWNPALLFQTKSGGNWTVGNYDSDDLKFVYFNATNIANNTNTASANISFKSDGTIACLGTTSIKAWTQLATAKSGTAMTYTLPSGYSEILVAAVCTYTVNSIRSYAGSVVIPKALISTTNTEWLLGGGKASAANSASGQRYASIQITTTKATGVGAYVDGVDKAANTTFYVYAR